MFETNPRLRESYNILVALMKNRILIDTYNLTLDFGSVGMYKERLCV